MKRWRSLSVFVLVLTAVYLYALPSATILYFVNVALHSGLGVLVALALLVYLFRGLGKRFSSREIWLVVSDCGRRPWYCADRHRHGAPLQDVAVRAYRGLRRRRFFLPPAWMLERGWLGVSPLQRTMRFALLLVATAGVAAGAWWARNVAWQSYYQCQQSRNFTRHHGKRRRRPARQVFSQFRANHRWEDTFPQTIFCNPRPANAATLTFTSNGKVPLIIFPRSTISGTAKALSTCRKWMACNRPNGAPAATIRHCCSAA